MAAGTEFSPYAMLESGFNKGNMSTGEDVISQNSDHIKQMAIRKPPKHASGVRHSMSTATLQPHHDPWSLNVSTRGPEMRFFYFRRAIFLCLVDYDYKLTHQDFGVGIVAVKSVTDGKSEYLPMIRSGSCAEKGPKQYMEDEHICIDNLLEYLDGTEGLPSPGAFYGVFDGHGGTDAAIYVRKNILKFIIEDSHFPVCLEKAIQNAFVRADHAFADNASLDISSGTTVLTALVFGRMMVVANAGDCRAVLGKRGKAIELSTDHKPNSPSERSRIEQLGGAIYDGYLNGQLSVARALGDWHMKGPKGSACPLSAEPELQQIQLTEDDEFLIIGCDGLWDVMSSQCAVTITRRELMVHNDPERCSKELVREALKRNTCDNLTVIVICFSPEPPPRIDVAPPRVRRSISVEGLSFLKGVLDGNS